MKSKSILPIDKLILEIRKKGIIIDDENVAKEILTRLNYQRLLAYRNKFLISDKPEVYKANTNFKDIVSIYKFDRELKFLIQKNIESIELMMRTLIAHNLGINYGDHAHLDDKHFKSQKFHSDFKKILFEKTDRTLASHKKHQMVKYHHDKYSDELPIYKAIELLTFGELSKLFSNLKDTKDNVNNKKLIIDKLLPLNYKLTEKILASWLKTLVDIRNMCAHHELLYCRIFEISPLREKKWFLIAAKMTEDKKPLYSIFGIFLIFNFITLDREVYKNTIDSLKSLFIEYADVVEPKDIYFPDNWENYL